MSGGMLRPASILRTSFDASSSAWPGATSAFRLTENCRLERCSVRRAEAALEPRDVVDADRPASPTARSAGRSRRCRAADSRARGSSPDTARRPPVVRDLVVAGDDQAQRVADRRHADAEIGGALPVDGHVDLGVRDVAASMLARPTRLGSLLRLRQQPLRVVVQLVDVRSEQRGCWPRSRTAAASPPPSGLRAVMLGLVARMLGEPIRRIACDDLVLRDLPLVDRQRVDRGGGCGCSRSAPARYGSICATPSMPLELLDAALARSRWCPRATCPSRRVDVDGPLAHVLVRHERAADHPVERERHQEHDDRDRR